MKIKICGLTSKKDALMCAKYGADALGFVFYKPSARYISPIRAKEIIKSLPPFVLSVGLFVNESIEFINKISNETKMQLAQIIDDKNVLDFAKLNIKAIKVLRVKDKKDLENLEKDTFYLLDAFTLSFGGSGKKLDLELLKSLDCSKIILAGGINESYLKDLISFDFYALDLSSSLEKTKGIKDETLVKKFMKSVKELDDKS